MWPLNLWFHIRFLKLILNNSFKIEDEIVRSSSLTLDFVLIGFLIGGHVMRLCHGHDESLTIPGAEKSGEEQRLVLRHFSSIFRLVPSFLVIKESLLQTAEIPKWFCER